MNLQPIPRPGLPRPVPLEHPANGIGEGPDLHELELLFNPLQLTIGKFYILRVERPQERVRAPARCRENAALALPQVGPGLLLVAVAVLRDRRSGVHDVGGIGAWFLIDLHRADARFGINYRLNIFG